MIRAMLLALTLCWTAALPAGAGNVGINLAAVHDWSPQAPFLDQMRSARPWIGHLPGQWGGMDADDLRAGDHLDGDGWPLRLPRTLGSIGTLILADMPEGATGLAGRYVLRFDGRGVVEVGGRASNVRYGRGQVSFDYTPGPGQVDIRIQRTRTSDPVRNITVVHEDHLQAFDTGERFNPEFLARLDGFTVLRFMDWMQTNNSQQARWEDRPEPDDYTWAEIGVPLEVMIELANRMQADPWFTLPHQADDGYIRRFAEMVEARLDTGLTAWAEYSNEVWNWQFDQARWADEQALARWGAEDAWVQFYALRATQMARIWRETFGGAAPARLKTVISTQTGWPGLEDQILTAPRVLDEGVTPVDAFDAYAVTAYFGGILGTPARLEEVRGWLRESAEAAEAMAEGLGLSGDARTRFIEENRYDLANARAGYALLDGGPDGPRDDTVLGLLEDVLPHHAAVAARNGLELVVYEGGSHVVGLGGAVEDAELTAFFAAFSYSPQMGVLYDRLLKGWAALSDGVFAAFNDVYTPVKWGSWGALRHLQDDNPRWQALVQHRDQSE